MNMVAANSVTRNADPYVPESGSSTIAEIVKKMTARIAKTENEKITFPVFFNRFEMNESSLLTLLILRHIISNHRKIALKINKIPAIIIDVEEVSLSIATE